ncbi:unnamed protein product [Victoria cruziana]
MAKGKSRRRLASRQARASPYPQKNCRWKKHLIHKNQCKTVEATGKKDWDDITCSVCMEYPHNAVLLLCSSHDKGCRPYMCGTSYRYSNCLDQFKKAYGKASKGSTVPDFHGLSHSTVAISDSEDLSLEDGSAGNTNMGWSQPREKWEFTELVCPLCRGTVKGCTVVESARAYLNTKKRSCMQDGCSYIGNYEELRKHVKAEHPCARPREVDPVLQQNWRRLEHEREHDDVLSTIRSTMPGAMVLGDYVIEGNGFGSDGDEVGIDESNWLNVLLLFQAFGPNGNMGGGRNFSSRLRRLARGYRRLEMGPSGLSRSRWHDEALTIITSDEDESPSINTSAATTANATTSAARGRANREDSARRRRSRRRSLTDLT